MKEQERLPDRISDIAYKEIDNGLAFLRVSYQPIVYNSERNLTAQIKLIPRTILANSPVEVQLRGFSCLQTINNDEICSPSRINEQTQQSLFETEQKLQANLLMAQSKQFSPSHRKQIEQAKKQKQVIQIQSDGEYFLEGCQVLYQLSQQSQERLEDLEQEKQYIYPVQFSLPSNLPVSVSHLLLKNIHITIRYSLELKLIAMAKNGKRQVSVCSIPFDIIEQPKTYPYEQLVAQQKIRCYHAKGKKKDKLINHFVTKFIRCLCPQVVFEHYIHKNKIFKTSFSNYDLFHLELLVVVSRQHNIFLTVRAYQDPETESLTRNRQKKQETKTPIIKEVKSMTEVPNDISLVSMKDTQRKNVGFGVQKAEVEMIGQISNICSEVIFKKMIYLNQCSYDMVVGQGMVRLQDYLNHPHSFSNQLFTLKYTFKVTAYFGEGEQQSSIEFQNFVVEQAIKELPL